MSAAAATTSERICRLCGRLVSEHGEDPEDCPRRAIMRIETLEKRAASIVQLAGAPGTCKGCGAAIFWLRAFRSGKNVLYDANGVTHFATCPKAGAFRAKGGKTGENAVAQR